MTDRGIGTFVQAAVSSHEVTAGNRIVDHAAPGEEQVERSFLRGYGIRADGNVRMAMSAFVQVLVVSDEITIDDLMSFIGRTWIRRRDDATSRSEDNLSHAGSSGLAGVACSMLGLPRF
jgi:hypothetical protein